ncbi:hypothetical protein SEA_YARA_44 [Streptomyces phage Yara]|nr:hypothetical protein SEA_YARA_44 [Streptomyces phage Yara]
MSRMIVQALYIAKSGRTYRSQPIAVAEGQELFDFESSLKYQLHMKDYVIEFVNDRGHKQFVQPGDLETIIAAQLGYEQPPVAPVVEEAPANRVEPNLEWTEAEKDMIRRASGGRVVERKDKPDLQSEGLIVEHKFSSDLPAPNMPKQRVYTKASSNEETQEMTLPFAAIDTVARVTGTNQAQGPARTAASQTFTVKMGADTYPKPPTP